MNVEDYKDDIWMVAIHLGYYLTMAKHGALTVFTVIICR